MAIQMLVPLQAYPEGNFPKRARHDSVLAKQLDAALHALVLNADFPAIGSPLTTQVIVANGLIEAAKARCSKAGDNRRAHGSSHADPHLALNRHIQRNIQGGRHDLYT